MKINKPKIWNFTKYISEEIKIKVGDILCLKWRHSKGGDNFEKFEVIDIRSSTVFVNDLNIQVKLIHNTEYYIFFYLTGLIHINNENKQTT